MVEKYDNGVPYGFEDTQKFTPKKQIIAKQLDKQEKEIKSNTKEIKKNTAADTVRNQEIKDNKKAIAENASADKARDAKIASNTSAISANTAKIADNTAKIIANSNALKAEITRAKKAEKNLQDQIDAIVTPSTYEYKVAEDSESYLTLTDHAFAVKGVDQAIADAVDVESERAISAETELEDSIENISLVKTSDLVYTFTNAEGEETTINIPEDQFLEDVTVSGSVLTFTFKVIEGGQVVEKTVEVDLGENVTYEVAEDSADYLSISDDHKISVLVGEDGLATKEDVKDFATVDYVDAETNRAVSAETDIMTVVTENELVASQGIKKLADVCGAYDADNHIKYIPTDEAKYISGATSLKNADDILDSAIKSLEAKVDAVKEYIILKAPNGGLWKLSVDNDGMLMTQEYNG